MVYSIGFTTFILMLIDFGWYVSILVDVSYTWFTLPELGSKGIFDRKHWYKSWGILMNMCWYYLSIFVNVGVNTIGWLMLIPWNTGRWKGIHMVLWFISWIGRASQFVSGKKTCIRPRYLYMYMYICYVYIMYISIYLSTYLSIYLFIYIMYIIYIYIFACIMYLFNLYM